MTFRKSRFDKKIPIAPLPKVGESLGGWYARISLGYSVTVHTALPVIDLSEVAENYIDSSIIDDLSEKLFKATDIRQRVWRRMIEPEAKLTNMWLKYQPKTEYCFPQLPNYYCIECFLEDMERIGQTYYRVEWNSPFILSCHKHLSPLMNNKFSKHENAVCKLDTEKFISRVSYAGQYEIINRSWTKLNGNYISPMARRVSNLFSLDDKVAKRALRDLGRHNDLPTARSAAVAVLQILSFRSWETKSQCLGRILFTESNCKEFNERHGYDRHSLALMPKEDLTTCFEQVGWFICHPTKFERYGLKEVSIYTAHYFRSEGLSEKFKKDQLVLLYAMMLKYQGYHFVPEVRDFHPLFMPEWKRALDNFYEVVEDRYLR